MPTANEVPWDEAHDAPAETPELDRWCVEHARECAALKLYFVEPKD